MRGIYPPVLADRGLGDAIRALALDTPLPIVLDVDLPDQVELPVASAVYFSVAEALANVTKRLPFLSSNIWLAARIRSDVVTASMPGAGCYGRPGAGCYGRVSTGDYAGREHSVSWAYLVMFAQVRGSKESHYSDACIRQ